MKPMIRKRIFSSLFIRPLTRKEMTEICHASRASINKIVQSLQQENAVHIVAHKTHIGYRGAKTPVPVYGLRATREMLALRSRMLAEQMEELGADIDYYGGMADCAIFGRTLISEAQSISALAEMIEGKAA